MPDQRHSAPKDAPWDRDAHEADGVDEHDLEMRNLDVVICTHTAAREAVMRRSIAGILDGLKPGDSLTVVLDNPEDRALADRLQEFIAAQVSGYLGTTGQITVSEKDSPGLTVISHQGPKGLAGARNTGVKNGSAPIIVFIDDDAVVRPGWRSAIITAMNKPDVLGVGAGVHAAVDGGLPRWVPAEHLWAIGCDFERADDTTMRNPIGAGMAVRRHAIETVGGFNTRFGRVGNNAAGAEETELFIRMNDAFPNGIITRAPGFDVDHNIDAGRIAPRYFLRRGFAEGRSKAALSGLYPDDLGSEMGHSRFVLGNIGRSLVSGHIGRAALSAGILGATGFGFLTGRRLPAAIAEDRSEIELTIAICTKGSKPQKLATAIRSVQATLNNCAARTEILLVDNSPAGKLGTTPELATLLDVDATMRVVRAPVRGLSRARNVAIREAHGKFLGFCDDDAVLAENWATEILTAFATPTETPWCVTGRTLPLSLTTRTQRWFEQAVSFDRGDHAVLWARHGAIDAATGTPKELPPIYPWTAGCFGAGNNMAFDREKLAGLGGFAEELGAGRPTRGGEDLEAFRNVILAGGTIYYTPDAVVHHYHRDNKKDLTMQMFGYGAGMTASLTRGCLTSAKQARAIMRSVPKGVGLLVKDRRGSHKGITALPENGRKPAEAYPRPLILIEAAGCAAGPFLLLYTLLVDNVAAVKGQSLG